MNKRIFNQIAIVLAMALTLFGTGYAGWFDSDEKPKSETQSPGTTSGEQAMPQAEQVTISGTISENSQLVDDQGKAFELADTDEGLEIKALIGKKVEITGTVMEEAGTRVVEVNEYRILEE